MRTFKIVTLGVILSGLSFSLASPPILAITSDMPEQNIYVKEFKLLDANGNDKLSATEVKKDALFNGNGFASADKNHNGSLSEDEYATYKSKVQQKESRQAVSDGAITSKIKSKYLLEKNFKSLDVSVKTKEGIVVLSGFVDNQSTKSRAGKIAAGVKGVKAVSNGLIVKP